MQLILKRKCKKPNVRSGVEWSGAAEYPNRMDYKRWGGGD
jgi:hypothetical protein